MTYGRGGEPPSTTRGSVEASSHATVNSVRPSSTTKGEKELAPLVGGGASSSRDGRAEGGGDGFRDRLAESGLFGGPAQDETVSDDHDHDEDGAVCFDKSGEAPHLRVNIPPDVPIPS